MDRRIRFMGIVFVAFAFFPLLYQAQADSGPVGKLISIVNMSTPRAAHSATLLPNGKVLIAGGMVYDQAFLDSAELFDPTTQTFSSTGNMTAKRTDQTATMLLNGKVLIVGGYGDGWLSSAELYDPGSGTFTATGSMSVPRDGFTSTLLKDGKVLITGGYDHGYRKAFKSAEIYDPATNTFSLTGDMSVERAAHMAVLLSDGRVLLIGGRSDHSILDSAEIYDPKTGQFTATGNMAFARYKLAAVALSDGKVLVLGGSNAQDEFGRYMSAETYDPDTGKFTLAGNMKVPRYKFSYAVTLLKSGQVLIAGSGKPVEIYDPKLSLFQVANGQLDDSRFYSTATLLADGTALITGGYGDNIRATDKAWIYQPPTEKN